MTLEEHLNSTRKPSPSANINFGLKGVKFDLYVLTPKTGKKEHVFSGHNLIMDSGLDQWGTIRSSGLTKYCRIGTGTGEVERDSGTTTFTRAGTTVTASAGIFVAGDVGSIIRWDTGEEAYIQTYTSTTVVETVDTGTIAADEGTIYHVDQVALDTQVKSSTTYQTASGDNSSVLAAGVITHKRTHIFTAEGGAVTYNEIAWSNNASGDIFNRAIISGGVSLTSSQQLVAISNLEIVMSPQTPLAQSDIGVGGFNTAGTFQIEGTGIAEVPASGAYDGFDEYERDAVGGGKSTLEPSVYNSSSGSNKPAFRLSTATTALGTFGTGVAMSAIDRDNIALSAYAAGNFYRIKSATFPTTTGNSSNINSIDLRETSDGSTWRLLLTSAQTKLNTQTLTISIRVAWQRLLVNS